MLVQSLEIRIFSLDFPKWVVQLVSPYHERGVVILEYLHETTLHALKLNEFRSATFVLVRVLVYLGGERRLLGEHGRPNFSFLRWLDHFVELILRVGFLLESTAKKTRSILLTDFLFEHFIWKLALQDSFLVFADLGLNSDQLLIHILDSLLVKTVCGNEWHD